MKIPIEMKHMPTSKSAIKLPITSAAPGPLEPSATYIPKGIKKIKDMNRKITSITTAEKNLPSTICVVDTGEVKRSCSVFVLFSSLKDFIVRIGKKIIRMTISPEK